MTRYKAALIHLSISVAVAAAMLVFMLSVWYPGPFFKAVGGEGLILILLGVDVVIGPLLTLIVFNTAKKSLKMDLTVVALLQFAAFAYGVSIVFEARPAYVVFVVDRFELVRAVEIDPQDRKAARIEQFKSLPLFRPQLIGVTRPTDPKEKTKALDLALQGKDLHLRPEYYIPYDQAQKDLVKQKLQPMSGLKALNPDAVSAIDNDIKSLGKKEDQVGYLPLTARNKDLAVVIDKANGEVLDYWAYRPWMK